MRRTRTLAAATLAAALTLSACAGDGSGKEAASGKVTVTMVESLTSPARTALLNSLIQEFEATHSNIDVELISPPTDQADAKIQQMLQSGSGVDVLEVRDLTVGPFSNNGWLHDMAPDLKGWDGMQAMTEQARTASSSADGKTWFVPYGFYGLRSCSAPWSSSWSGVFLGS